MKYILKNVNLLDGNLDSDGKMAVKPNVSILIDESKITEIVDQYAAFKDSEINNIKCYDLKGKYLMPGLINLHVHLAASGKPPKPNAKPKNYKALFDKLSKYKTVLAVVKMMEKKLARQYLYSGVTTIRTVGGILDIDGQVRDDINRGKCKGPQILTCNTAVSVPGGHFAGSLATEAISAEMAVSDIEKIASTKPDWIKLMITGGVMDASAEGEPGVLRMKPEIVKASCEMAHALGFKVAAHVESPEGVRVALENGVDSIEHGAVPDSEIIELFKKNNAIDVCTISPAVPYVMLPESISHCGKLGRDNGTIVMNGIIECAKVCLKNGITVGLGTDSGCNFVTAYDTWRELEYFVKYVGVTPDFALHTATAVNARILELDDMIGTVEKGKTANFLVCKENPLEKGFDVLKKPSMVIYRGKIIKNPVIRKRKDIQRALDSIR